MDKPKQHILVTGGAGHVGSTLCDSLLNLQDTKLVVLDNLITGSTSNLSSFKHKVDFFDCNINHPETLELLQNKYCFDYIFHYAALVGVERTQANPIQVLEDIEGIKHVIQLALNSKSKRVFFASSSEVYGEPVEIPQHENTTPLNSRVPYAIVKNICESFLKSYQQTFNLNYTILRLFNTYGPKQSGDFVMNRFIKAALDNEPIYMYGDGNQSRTFLHVDDHVNFVMYLLTNNLFVNDVVNVGSDKELPIIDLAKLIINLTGSRSKIEYLDPLKDGDMRRRRPDITKMKSEYKQNFVTLEEGILQCIQAVKKSKVSLEKN